MEFAGKLTFVTVEVAAAERPGLIDSADALAFSVALEAHTRPAGAVEEPVGILGRNEASLGEDLPLLLDSRFAAGVKGGRLDDEAFTTAAAAAQAADFPDRKAHVTLLGVVDGRCPLVPGEHGFVFRDRAFLVMGLAWWSATDKTDIAREG